MAVLVVPAAAYLLHLLLQILVGMASPQLGQPAADRDADAGAGLVGRTRAGWRTCAAGSCRQPRSAPIASAVVALYQVWVLDYLRPYGWLGGSAIGNGAIKFADLASLQALLSLVLVLTAADRARRLLGLAGLFCGMLSLALTQTRGALLGVLLAVAALGLALFLHRRRAHHPAPRRRHPRPRCMRACGGGPPWACWRWRWCCRSPPPASCRSASPPSSRRCERYLQGDIDSEVGQRLALWGAALRAGLHAPLTGVGFGHFDDELERQVAAGEIPRSERIIYGQPHSEYLSAFAEAGVTRLPGAAADVRRADGRDGGQDRAGMAARRPPVRRWSPRRRSRASRSPTTCSTARSRSSRSSCSTTGSCGPPCQPADKRPSVSRGRGNDGLPVGGGDHQERGSSHRALPRSVAFADQVVVVDSGSTDDTVAVARGLGAEVQVTPDWPGFGMQKNRALERLPLPVGAVDRRGRGSFATNCGRRSSPWCAVARTMPAINGYWIRRSSRFCGQTIRFGLWRNDQVLRLFRREGGRFTDDLVHERVICAEPMGRLQGTLYHDSVDSIEDAREKTFRYARAGAIQLRARGKGGRFSAWTHAIWSFVRGYLLRLGFLDGRNGLILACLTAQGTYWRYRWAGMEHDLGEK